MKRQRWENPKGDHKPQGSLNFPSKGSRVKGFVATQDELTGAGVNYKDIYEAFLKLLVTHSILTLESFFKRVKHCRTTPAEWMMLFLDKIHAVYRNRNGKTLLDEQEADPVGMTIAGLLPKKGAVKHVPTEAARQLFLEIMLDHEQAKTGNTSRWECRISGPSI